MVGGEIEYAFGFEGGKNLECIDDKTILRVQFAGGCLGSAAGAETRRANISLPNSGSSYYQMGRGAAEAMESGARRETFQSR